MSSTPKTEATADAGRRLPVTLPRLAECKRRGEAIVMATAYDFPSGQIVDAAGADIVLVGDSGAEVVLGYDSTVAVSVEEMLMLTAATRRGVRTALLVGRPAVRLLRGLRRAGDPTAQRFVKEARADAVKLEGGGPASALADPRDRRGRHPGDGPHRPDAPDRDGARRPPRPGPHGRARARARRARRSRVEEAGASRSCSRRFRPRSPTRSRGARRCRRSGSAPARPPTGRCSSCTTCSASTRASAPRFAKQYADLRSDMVLGALSEYAEEVRTRRFPAAEHTFSIDPAGARGLP
jgi:3-methyl-2-oxobutanoate hydroxymethyltransferase